MDNLDGILNFIKENKEFLEKMNQEMKSNYGQAPLVWMTIDEAKGILWDLRDLYKQTYGYDWLKQEPWFDEFKNRIKQAQILHLKQENNRLKADQARDNRLKNQFLRTVKQEVKYMQFLKKKETLPNINSQLTLNGKEVEIIFNLLEEFTDTMNTSEYDIFKKLEKHLYEPKKDNDYNIETECEIQNLQLVTQTE